MKFSTHSEYDLPIPNPEPFIKKAVGLYETIKAEKQGRIVFVVGELGSGKTEIMRALEIAFSELKPKPSVVAGGFIRGEYKSFNPQVNVDIAQTSDTVGNLSATLAKIISPRFEAFLDFGGQLLQMGGSGLNLLKAHTANSPDLLETPYGLVRMLRALVIENPLICIINDFDKAQEGFNWNSLLLSLAEEIAVDLPMLFIVSIAGKARVGEHQKDETNLEFVTRELVNRGLAEWWYLMRMTKEEIADWIKLDTSLDIVSQLHGATGGNPRWVKNLWLDWRLSGAVVFNENRQIWEWSVDKRPAINPFKSVFEDLLITLLATDDIRKHNEAKKILGTAALEGKTFTVKALSSVLNLDDNELVDYLDDNLVQDENHPNGILLEEGFLNIEDAPNLKDKVFRYSFVSDWHWHVLEHYVLTPEEKLKTSHEMVKALRATYEHEERLTAHSLARLYTFIGDKEAAKHYQTMADFSMHHETMRSCALAILKTDTSRWSKFRYYQTARFLFKAGHSMIYAFPFLEVLQVFEKSNELARLASDTLTQAGALYSISLIHRNLGEIEIAIEKINKSLQLYTQIREKDGIARSLHFLGKVEFGKGNYEEAKEKTEEALQIWKELGRRKGIAESLGALVDIAIRTHAYEEAKDKAEKVLRICEELGDKFGITKSLSFLATIARVKGDYEEAKDKAEKALYIREELGDKIGFAHSLSLLGQILLDKGDYEEAKEKTQKALQICEELDDEFGTAFSHYILGKIAFRKGEKEIAKQHFRVSLDIMVRIDLGNADAIRADLRACD